MFLEVGDTPALALMNRNTADRARRFRSEVPVMESEQERRAREFMKVLTGPDVVTTGE
ncbi:MAG: hypothetical protein JJ992_23185 [Planctomycetes bacterium]|nr:hypothetical protein [Planctomycetota bacterium]